MKSKNRIFGDEGELCVAQYLEQKGYKILERQFTSNQKIGEVDIIAKKDMIIAFVEVKRRKINHQVTIEQLVSKKKQKAIIKMALCFLQKNNISISDFIIRFDIAYLLEEKLQYYENAFTL